MPPTVTDDELDKAAELVGQPATEMPAAPPGGTASPVATQPALPLETPPAPPVAESVPAASPTAASPAAEPVPPPTPAAVPSATDEVVKKVVEIIAPQFNELKSMLQPRTEKAPAQPTPPVLTEFPTTPEEFAAAVQAETERVIQRNAAERADYESKFVEKVYQMGDGLPREEQNEIYKELMANFNNVITKDPIQDAEINYAKAERAYLRKKLAQPSAPKPVDTRPIPLANTPPQVPIGVEGGSRNAPPSAKPIELDEHAKEFVRRTNMSEKSQLEALTGPVPNYLSGR
jgi:hypothetical protein